MFDRAETQRLGGDTCAAQRLYAAVLEIEPAYTLAEEWIDTLRLRDHHGRSMGSPGSIHGPGSVGGTSQEVQLPTAAAATRDHVLNPVEYGQPPVILTAGQHRALELAESGANLFITGAAGTGKSVVLGRIIERLVGQHGAGAVFITASTGHAAALLPELCPGLANIKATTLHSFAGLNPRRPRGAEQSAATQRRWAKARVLIIDEISMVGASTFDEVAAGSSGFQGVQLICAGDFLQLPPVGQLQTFRATAWEGCGFEHVVLQAVVRQTDLEFLQVLAEVRRGRVSAHSDAWLRDRCSAVDESDGVTATLLFTKNEPKDALNSRQLARLPGREVQYDAVDSGRPEDLSHCRARKQLRLRVGAQVVCLRNLPSKGLVNGSRGVVVRMESNAVVVGFSCPGSRGSATAEKRCVRLQQMIIPGYSRKQIPLDLAWGLTIHAAQGMSLDKLVLDLRDGCFSPAQAYVGLSRARDPDRLQVIGWNSSLAYTCPQCEQWMASIGALGDTLGQEESEDPTTEEDDESWEDVSGLEADLAEDDDVDAADYPTRHDDDPTALHVGLAPPEGLRRVVGRWHFVTRFLAGCLVDWGEISWAAAARALDCEAVGPEEAPTFASDHDDADDSAPPAAQLQALRRLSPFLPQWATLPLSQLSTLTLAFSAQVVVTAAGELRLQPQWPEVVQRRREGHRGRIRTGYGKRCTRRYGALNLLSLRLPLGTAGGTALDMIAGRKIVCSGRRYRLRALSPSRKACQLEYLAEDAATQEAADSAWDPWHLSPVANGPLTVAKSLARTKLASSSTVATVCLHPEQLRLWAGGEHLATDECTDGACGVSPDLLDAAWAMFREQTGMVDEGIVPSGFQARIHTLKGFWYADRSLPPGTLEYRTTQRKWQLAGEPSGEQLCLEICRFAVDKGPARLNKQAIQVLKDRLADPMLIDELLSETLEAERHVLTCQEHALRFCRGGHGGSEAQQVLEMLHSHWELSDELVQALLRKALVFHADMLMENLHLTIPKSRRYTIIPDWTLTLQPDEVIFKVNARPLEGPAVCFRNPCYDGSEILAVTMADLHTVAQRAPTPELREAARCFFSDAHDVIIMSGQPIGHGSTARSVVDVCQGADYDGDELTVIWDERFVTGLRPPTEGKMEYSAPRKALLPNTLLGSIAPAEQEEVAWNTFRWMVVTPDMIGRISVVHSAWAALDLVDQRSGLLTEAGRKCRLLADMAHKAIDARTAGYVMDNIPHHIGRPSVDTSKYGKASTSELFDVAHTRRIAAEQDISLFATLWLTYASWARHILGDGPSVVAPHPVLEQPKSGRIEALQEARQRLRQTQATFAEIYESHRNSEEADTAAREKRMRALKYALWRELAAKSAGEREHMASAWYTLMREDLNGELAHWQVRISRRCMPATASILHPASALVRCLSLLAAAAWGWRVRVARVTWRQYAHH